MSLSNTLACELNFAVRDRSLWFWMIIILCLSSAAVIFGLAEVEKQKTTIQQLVTVDQQNRLSELEKQKDWGSAAYYSFHLTYDPPSDFAFAAMGLRDTQPWKHRIRMLALEGQIYERDVGNPSAAMIGRFDFAFLAAFIFPLILIIVLHDIRASEKTAGRYDLLEATAGEPFLFWLSRLSIRVSALFLCLILPLLIAGIFSGATLNTLIVACFWILIFTVFWGALCFWVSAWHKPGSIILMTLVSIWVTTAVIIPAGAKYIIDRLEPITSGAEILMLQREAVNDAWDLPREITMDAFFSRHPEWSDYKPIESYFEWQWYYAFQQVGDQQAETLSNAYRKGRLQRERMAGWIAYIAPPSLLERSLQDLADTNLYASFKYEEKVRAYHASLRAFYYPKFFRNQPFDKSLLEGLPMFDPR